MDNATLAPITLICQKHPEKFLVPKFVDGRVGLVCPACVAGGAFVAPIRSWDGITPVGESQLSHHLKSLKNSLNTTGQDSLADGLAADVAFISLHTDNPGTTGANEVTGGTPPYARQPVVWNVASSGRATNNGALTFNVPAATTIRHAGFFSLITAGVFRGYAPFGTPLRGLGTALASSDAIQSDNHGLVNTDALVVLNVMEEALPAGLTEGDKYFVVGATTDTFQLSLTSGGAAINITTDGELAFQRLIEETFAGQGQLTIPDQQLSIRATVT